MFSLFWGFLVDWTCFLCLLLMVKLRRGWEFDEINRKPSPTEKRNSYREEQIKGKGVPLNLLQFDLIQIQIFDF